MHQIFDIHNANILYFYLYKNIYNANIRVACTGTIWIHLCIVQSKIYCMLSKHGLEKLSKQKKFFFLALHFHLGSHEWLFKVLCVAFFSKATLVQSSLSTVLCWTSVRSTTRSWWLLVWSWFRYIKLCMQPVVKLWPCVILI